MNGVSLLLRSCGEYGDTLRLRRWLTGRVMIVAAQDRYPFYETRDQHLAS